MWWVLVLVGIVAAWLYFRQNNNAEKSRAPEKTLREKFPAPKATVSAVPAPTNSPAEASQEDSVTIGKNLPFPLKLSGLSLADAEKLVSGIEACDWNTKGWLTLLFAKNNVRCEEIDEWVATARPKLDSAVKKGIAASSEWATASELDKSDILEEITLAAAEALDVRPANINDTLTLLKGEPADATVDDVLLEKFKGNSDCYFKLLSLLGSPGRVWQSAAGQYDRKEFETLAEMGFVRRGTDIPIEDILPTFTLAQMQKIAGDAAPKKFTRKAAAIEILKGLPDLQQRLASVISFRELFQLKPLENLDVQEVSKSYEYAMTLTDIVWKTLMAGKSSMENVADPGYEVDGWELSANDCCPSCAKMDGKSWKRRPSKLPPFHVGCSCEISPV